MVFLNFDCSEDSFAECIKLKQKYFSLVAIALRYKKRAYAVQDLTKYLLHKKKKNQN